MFRAGAWGVVPLLASEAVDKCLKYRLLSANLGMHVVPKKRQYLCLFANNTSTWILIDRKFTQHDAPADDEPKKSRNERGHAILSQALARI